VPGTTCKAAQGISVSRTETTQRLRPLIRCPSLFAHRTHFDASLEYRATPVVPPVLCRKLELQRKRMPVAVLTTLPLQGTLFRPAARQLLQATLTGAPQTRRTLSLDDGAASGPG
jgi:hypothetical protein